ncbi:MAG: tetratricopeptide repeat protein [Candidatus Omnitrophota bacterium]
MSPSSRKTLRGLILIIILGCIVYFNSLNGAFLCDDNNLIEDNPNIKSWSNIKKIFTQDIGQNIGVAAGGEYNFYRPLQMLTYMADYFLWGQNPTGYHITNSILHILAALSLYWLIGILFSDWLISLFCALFYVIHPVHTEAVSYISGRADPLALLFILLCLAFYIKSASPGKNPILFLSACLSFILALLSKESALILPALLLLYHYAFRKKIMLKRFLPILIIALAYIILRATVLAFTLPDLSTHQPFLKRIPSFFAAVVEYLRLLFLPLNLHMEYGNGNFSFYDLKVIAGIIVTLAGLACILLTRKRNGLVFFSLSWFLLMLLPVSGIYPINAYMAEHWLYLPSVGFFLILAKYLALAYKRKVFKTLSLVIIIIAVAFYSYLTIRQNNYWKGPVGFYEKTLEYAPDNIRVLCNLGNEYWKMGKAKEAVPLLKKAIEINPAYAEPYNNLGSVYVDLGRNEEAIPVLKKAIEINPGYLTPYINLAVAYFNIGDNEKGFELLNKALEINPNSANTHFTLAVAYFKQNNYALSIKHCDMAIKLGYKVDPKLLRALEPFRR